MLWTENTLAAQTKYLGEYLWYVDFHSLDFDITIKSQYTFAICVYNDNEFFTLIFFSILSIFYSQFAF